MQPTLHHLLTASCAAVFTGLFAAQQPVQAQAQPPNILLIVADDMGAEALRSYGGMSYDTPHLDALAVSGRQYSYAISCPLCTPSRVQLLTGQYNFRNYESFGWLDPKETTIAEVLQDQGYATTIAGKWQLSAPDLPITTESAAAPNVTPEDMRDGYGFDEYHLWQLNGKGSRYWKPRIEHNAAVVSTAANDYGPDLHADYLVDFMRRQTRASKPFFALYSLTLPHDPWQSTPDSDTPKVAGSTPAYFKDNVEYIDKQVGRLVAALEELNIRENTLVIFTSDNGTSPSITSQTTRGPVRGDKGNPTDAGTHVPLIVSWQGEIAPGQVSEQLVDFSDILPTLAAVARAAVPEGLTVDGRAFLNPNGSEVLDGRDAIYQWYDPKGRKFAPAIFARDRRYKHYADGRFFDLSRTPLERGEDAITPGAGTPEAEAARASLRQVIDRYAIQVQRASASDAAGVHR